MPIDVVDVLNRIKPIIPDAKSSYTDAILEGGQLFEQSGITTPLRMAHLLAQGLHETGRFTVLRESLNYSAQRLFEVFGVNRSSAAVTREEASELAHHEQEIAERVYGPEKSPRLARMLGNTKEGDAFLYRGNGFLQMTGRGAHQAMTDFWKVDFIGQPELATAPENALKPPLREWTERGLNAFADKNDIRTITQKINGGFNGLAERKILFDRVFALLQPGVDAANAGEADNDVSSLQRDLNTLGARPQLKVDGRFGPNTERAVKEFQVDSGIVADGIPGPVTMATIKLMLDNLRGG